MENIFNDIPEEIKEEVFDNIFSSDNIHIERILSEGQSTSPGEWLSEDKKEWVILLKGSAGILFEGDKKLYGLKPGDYLFIESQRKHRVEYTDPNCKTIWLAVHFK